MEFFVAKANTSNYFNTDNILHYVKGTTLYILFMWIYTVSPFLFSTDGFNEDVSDSVPYRLCAPKCHYSEICQVC